MVSKSLVFKKPALCQTSTEARTGKNLNLQTVFFPAFLLDGVVFLIVECILLLSGVLSSHES